VIVWFRQSKKGVLEGDKPSKAPFVVDYPIKVFCRTQFVLLSSLFS
jgi:hypothetical protein